jgi:sarcosine oxidase subunit alpha
LDEHPAFGDPNQPIWGNRFADFAQGNGVDFRPGSTVWGLFSGNVLGIVDVERSYQLQAERVILATGSVDLPCPFPGSSLPGIFTFRAMNVMLHKWGIFPWKRFVVVGDGDDIDNLEGEIEFYGGEIAARLAGQQGRNLKAFGEHGVEAVEIDGSRFEADVIVINIGRQPDIELALMAECEVGYSKPLGGFVPIRDENLQTSKPGIFVAGEAAGIGDSTEIAAEGFFAGVSAIQSLGIGDVEHYQMVRSNYQRQAKSRLEYVAQLSPSYAQV